MRNELYVRWLGDRIQLHVDLPPIGERSDWGAVGRRSRHISWPSTPAIGFCICPIDFYAFEGVGGDRRWGRVLSGCHWSTVFVANSVAV